MAKIQVLATKLGIEHELVPRTVYAAQVFADGNDSEAVWICVHDHKSAIEAQMCGVEFVTEHAVDRRHRGAA